MNKMYCY